MRTIALGIMLLFVLAPAAQAHKFNHENRHEMCNIYGDPAAASESDGHKNHTHNKTAGLALPDHDPCKQVRMNYPSYQDAVPLLPMKPELVPINLTDLLFSDGNTDNTEVFVGGEAYQLPVNETEIKQRMGFAVTSDQHAEALDLPGNGSPENPYIVEGYVVTGNMLFKDTGACFVVRNNVVVNRAVVAPLIPDPEQIIRLLNLTPYWEWVNHTAHSLRSNYTNLSANWDALKAVWDGNLSLWDADKAILDEDLAGFEANAAAWQGQFDAFEADYIDMVLRSEGLADEFTWYAGQYSTVPEPPRSHASYIDYVNQNIPDMAALRPIFEAYQQDLDDDVLPEDLEGWVMGNPPPQDPPSDWPHGAEMWELEKENYAAIQAAILELIDEYWGELIPGAPDLVAYQTFLDDYAAFQDVYDAFMVDYDAFVADYDGFMADFNEFQDEFELVWQTTGEQISQANLHFQKALDNVYEYAGSLGTTLFNTTDQLIRWVLKVLFGILDILDPNEAARNTGQMIFDWNGQCVHAYNNVVADLRVNQNNDRTGFATGGIVEDNRFFTIGQIRHYDGIFRQNEVGNRAFAASLVNRSVVPIAQSAVTMNNDGANQGWYENNTFYGAIDLDFHGHHHSAGFFAPTSHYHGSNAYIVEMKRADGSCVNTTADVNQNLASGPNKDYPQDDDIEILGQVLVPGDSDAAECLDHMDHAKRWTSVLFNDNIVIDPNGQGIRFEDRNHRADDEWAASENVYHLKSPHFHQKWVQMENNTIVGKILIDVLNAAGTDLWSDDWEPVLTPAGLPRTQEALAHPGAEIINSHPYRNDAWLDLNDNDIFVTQSTGILVADADDMTRFNLTDNRAFAVPANASAPNMTAAQFVAWLKGAHKLSTNAVNQNVTKWGTQDRGFQAFATLSNVRDHYTVNHCRNAQRGLNVAIVAKDRMYNDFFAGQGVQSCGGNDWGTIPVDIDLAYRAAPAAPQRCTENLRQETAHTDDFYVTEYAFDTLDSRLAASTCYAVPLLAPGGTSAVPSLP